MLWVISSRLSSIAFNSTNLCSLTMLVFSSQANLPILSETHFLPSQHLFSPQLQLNIEVEVQDNASNLLSQISPQLLLKNCQLPLVFSHSILLSTHAVLAKEPE